MRYNSVSVTQMATQYDNSGALIAFRMLSGSTWSPWEWLNPPMKLGVEYRTVERYLGKPVYTKLVNFGSLPNTANRSVDHGCENVQYVISADICDITGGTLITDYDAISNFGVTTTVITINTIVDMSTHTAYVSMRYIKTTA